MENTGANSSNLHVEKLALLTFIASRKEGGFLNLFFFLGKKILSKWNMKAEDWIS